MPFAANPGSPALRSTRLSNPTLLVLALAASSVFAACGGAAHEEPGWRDVASAPSVDDSVARTATTDSLGDPFVLIANSTDLPLRRTDMWDSGDTPTNAEVESAWAMLRSDACDVELASLHIAFQRTEGGSTGWLTTAESTSGVVLDASPQLAVVRYETTIRVDRDAGWSTGELVPATVDIEVRQDGDKVRMHTQLSSDGPNGETALRLEFVVEGAFDQNPEVIPDRRFACTH